MWANQSVLALGQWYAESKTGKFHPGIVITICTNQLHLQKNGLKKTESGIKDGFEKKELKFSVLKNFFIPTRETGLPIIFRHSVAPGNFPLK